MGSHPLNLGIRFLLELVALGAYGYWGWTQHEGWTTWLWMIGLPIVAAAVWGTFAVPDDPSRSGRAPVATPGAIRLMLELAFFTLAALALIASQQVYLGVIFAAMTIIHYAVSYDRILWLLRH